MKQNVEILGDYQILKSVCLGTGATGEVYYGQNMKYGYKVAAKRIDIDKITSSIEKQIENEIKNLANLASPFIVKLYDYFRCGKYIYLFLEYCEDGDLKTYLQKQKKNSGLCESEALMFMRHIIEGYKVLHSKNIIHRDIKPANILLKQGIAKLSDFGFSRVVNNPNQSQKLTLLGTPLYTAIEILNGNIFSSKCDVWSVGVVFYEMLHARTPWTGTDMANLKHNIMNKKIEFKESIHPQIKMLISNMLKLESKERISWEQIAVHPFFSKEIQLANSNLTAEDVDRNYHQSKNIFLEYLRNYIVKSYLRLSVGEVNFKESYEPSELAKKQIIFQFSKQITHKRNVSFFYAYLLALYYKNVKIIPKTVNRCMEFEYSLILRSSKNIKQIAEYFQKKSNEGSENWATFKLSAQYEELKKLLSNDFTVVEKLKKMAKKEAEKKFEAKELPQQTSKYFIGLDKHFDEFFLQIMKENYKQFASEGKKGVSALMCSYISEYVVNPKILQENVGLDFGAFYEKREKQYELG